MGFLGLSDFASDKDVDCLASPIARNLNNLLAFGCAAGASFGATRPAAVKVDGHIGAVWRLSSADEHSASCCATRLQLAASASVLLSSSASRAEGPIRGTVRLPNSVALLSFFSHR